MVDLNDLAVFDKVAAFRSFSVAARTLGLPKSSVSRAMARLENDLGIRLFQRSARAVELTPAGEALRSRCSEGLAQLNEAVHFAAGLAEVPRGTLRISAPIGFGVNVLGALLPQFLDRYPQVSVSIDLSSRVVDLVADRVDVAIRLGPLADSNLITTRLGSMKRYLCAAPSYLVRRGRPASLDDLATHDTIEMPGHNGRPRTWSFARNDDSRQIEIRPRISVNEALLINKLIMQGSGIGIISGYICAELIRTGNIVRVLPEWQLPSVDVSLVFPSRREMSSAVRAFIDYMREISEGGAIWMQEALQAS